MSGGLQCKRRALKRKGKIKSGEGVSKISKKETKRQSNNREKGLGKTQGRLRQAGGK